MYCFDVWVREMVKRGLTPIAQFHDEVVLLVKLGNEEKTREILKESIGAVNTALKLNRDLNADVQFGSNYSEIH